MGSLNDYAKAQEKSHYEREEIKVHKRMKGYGVFLLQLSFTMLFVIAAFFLAFSESGYAVNLTTMLREGLSMENSWLFPEEVQPVAIQEQLYSLPCKGEIKKAMIKNSTGGYDVAGLAFSAAAGENIFPVMGGTVMTIVGEAGKYALKVVHSDAVYTVYSGLREISVKEGDAVLAETVLGSLGSDNLLFAVYINDTPVDPTALFGQINN